MLTLGGSVPAKSEAIARFLAHHAVDRRTAVARDAAPFVGMSPERRAREVVAACRLTAHLIAHSPKRDFALNHVEPPHPDWTALTRRYRRDR